MPATPKRQGREPRPDSVFLSEVLAGNIRAARSRERRSQTDLAGHMATLGHPWSRATVSEVERSGRTVSLDEFFALAIALGVTPTDLVTAHGQEVDLGTSRPAPANLVRLWLAGWIRVFLKEDDGRLSVQPNTPTVPPDPATTISEWMVSNDSPEETRAVVEGLVRATPWEGEQ